MCQIVILWSGYSGHLQDIIERAGRLCGRRCSEKLVSNNGTKGSEFTERSCTRWPVFPSEYHRTLHYNSVSWAWSISLARVTLSLNVRVELSIEAAEPRVVTFHLPQTWALFELCWKEACDLRPAVHLLAFLSHVYLYTALLGGGKNYSHSETVGLLSTHHAQDTCWHKEMLD